MDEGLGRVFNRQEAKISLGTKIIGRKIYAYDLVTSTNDLAHFFAEQDEPEGCVVFAKGQTQGRGRLGNSWSSPYGTGLYFSFILRPQFLPQQASRVTLMTAMAVARALDAVLAHDVSINWPNDIFIKGKKTCGILTEMCLEGLAIKYIVVGIGLNVNTRKCDLPDGATSLKESAGKEFDIADLSHIIIKEIDRYYEKLNDRRFAEIVNEVKEHFGLFLGGRVRVAWEDRQVEGYAIDFDDDGCLVIRRDNGFLERISAGHLEMLA
jgi:BirA family biotin operon repressor/biotin-[acetyl-CoA-carboxylase] ligase